MSSSVPLAEQIQRSGGLLVSYEKPRACASSAIAWKNRCAPPSSESTPPVASSRISTSVLLDFPSRLNNEDVYLCWRLGEDRIRFYHRQDEGFSGRKPIDPRDADYQNPIQ